MTERDQNETPDRQPITELQAKRLAAMAGLDSREIVGSTVAELSEKFRWQIDLELLFFRRICGRVDPPGHYLSHGRCQRCALYWRRRGEERSLLPRPPRPCQTCGQLVQQFRRGRCSACYQYWHAYGRERPRRHSAGGR